MLWYLQNHSTELTYFFTNVLVLLRALNHESLSKIQNFEFPSNARCLQSASLIWSANFCFLPRPSYSASAVTVSDLLLPAKTVVHKKWLPAQTVCVILLPAESPCKSVMFGFCCDCQQSLAFCQDCCPQKMGSCPDCPCNSASCWESV